MALSVSGSVSETCLSGFIYSDIFYAPVSVIFNKLVPFVFYYFFFLSLADSVSVDSRERKNVLFCGLQTAGSKICSAKW